MIEEKVISFLLTDMDLSLSFVSFGGYDPDVIQSDEDQEKEMQAQQNGISPIMINVRDKDQMKQQKAYLGALLQMGE